MAAESPAAVCQVAVTSPTSRSPSMWKTPCVVTIVPGCRTLSKGSESVMTWSPSTTAVAGTGSRSGKSMVQLASSTTIWYSLTKVSAGSVDVVRMFQVPARSAREIPSIAAVVSAASSAASSVASWAHASKRRTANRGMRRCMIQGIGLSGTV